MAQFASSDAAIAILTDDEDSSENEIYSRPEPETESKSESRPMIGQSRGRGDGQSDASAGLQRAINVNGIGDGKRQPEVGVQSTETGSNKGCLGTALSSTAMLVLCLLVAAFPVHFPSVLLPDIRSTSVALRVTVCLAIVGAFTSSLTSQIVFKMAAGNFRPLSALGCVGVTAFSVVRCFRSAAPVAVLGCASFVAGFLLAAVRLAVAGEFRRPASAPSSLASLLDGARLLPRRVDGVSAAGYLACGLLTLICSGLAPFVSASLHFVLLADYSTSATDTEVPATSSMMTSLAPGLDDVTANQSSSFNCTDDVNISLSSPTTPPAVTAAVQSTTSAYTVRLEALLACYVLCSLGALLLPAFDNQDRRRKDKSPWTVSDVARLVLGPLSAFRRQDVALLSPLAVFVGAQQLFVYFAYLEVSGALQLND